MNAIWTPILVYHSNIHPSTKVMADFFSDAKINMIPSSDLHDFWWVYWMHVRVHFSCKIYWPFGLTLYPRGRKTMSVIFFKIKFISSLISCHLTDSDKIFQTSNLRRFLNLTQISWRLAPLLQNHERISVGHCVWLSISLCMLIWARWMTGLRLN